MAQRLYPIIHMLILKRKVGQSFLISGNITVKLLSTSRGVAIIGIDAPKAVPVLREEIVDRQIVATMRPEPDGNKWPEDSV